MTGLELAGTALAVGLVVALALVLKCWQRMRRIDRMLTEETRRALELDVTKSYEELLEEHRKLKAI